MPHTTPLDSLNLVLDDLSKEINLSINALESYLQIKDNNKGLKKSIAHLCRLKNIFVIFEMKGAEVLVIESIELIKILSKKSTNAIKKNQLEAVSSALVHLSHYSQYISKKKQDVPQLLIPTINEVRKSVGKAPFGEALFFDVDISLAKKIEEVVLDNNIELISQSRYFRQIYQIGLIEVLRKTNTEGGLNMMLKALKKLEEQCPHLSCSHFWWIAQATLIGFRDKKIKLTSLRMKIFSAIDREIKHIEYDNNLPIETAINNTNQLTVNMLYLISLIKEKTPLIDKVKSHFNITVSEFYEDALQQEFIRFKGPSSQDFESIGETLIEEIEIIESSVLFNDDDIFSVKEMNEAVKAMTNLNNLLKILHVENETLRLSRMIIISNNALKDEIYLKENEKKVLQSVLDSIKTLIEEGRLNENITTEHKKTEKLTVEAEKIRQLGHQNIKMIMADMHRFIKNGRVAKLLHNIPQLIKNVSQSFEKLGITAAIPILSRSSLFVEYHLMKHPKKINDESLELFADIISSLEFYLETLEKTTAPSNQILEFAHTSFTKLNLLNKSNYL